jgi:membrane protein required for colicin V production
LIWIDYILLAIIAISALLSLWRGFVKEALSLASWIAALWVALLFFHDLADWLACCSS